MSFWPFPKKLLERMRAAARRGPCVELGSGSGEFLARLRDVGIESIALDVDPSSLGQLEGVRIRADLRALPFADSCLGLLTLSNTVRHLPARDRADCLDSLARVLKSGGVVTLFEDAAEWRNESEHNYRRCLELLAQVDPRRGGVVDLDSEMQSTRLACVDAGEFDNVTELRDPMLPLRWLRTQRVEPRLREELASLSRSVRRTGMSVGLARYQVWERRSS